ncbi:MAG: lipid-A-disaccharide synthase [Cyanobacteria bacterium J06638_28]
MVQQQGRSRVAPPLHVVISTGEVSGDLQGSFLVKALYRQAQSQGLSLQVSALGGQRMAAAGADLIADTTAIGSVGLFEAIPYILPTLKVQKRLKQRLEDIPADLFVFLDYMGPNLTLGQFLQKTYPVLPTAYYIAPQQWVWTFSQKDTQTLVEISDRMIAVFPQEAEYYRQFGAQVAYFGHPLVDDFADPPTRVTARQSLGLALEDTVITLLPASRHQEVKYVLPLMLAVAERLRQAIPQVQFLLPLSMGKLRSVIESQVTQSGINARVIEGDTRSAIAAADLVLNKSGTVNLEVALLNVPQVVIYRLNPLTARIAYYLLNFRVDYVSPVNLFVNKSIIPEFLQWQATVDNVTQTSLQILADEQTRSAILAGYQELREQMGQPGVCDRVATELLTFASESEGKA